MKKLMAAVLCLLLIAGSAAAEPVRLPPVDEEEQVITLSLVGDCTIGDQWDYRGYSTTITYRISNLENGDMSYPFKNAAQLFAEDDLTIANCEGVFSTRNRVGYKYMALVADPKFAEVFAKGNVDVCNLANNHAKDCGAKGQTDTAEALRSFGVESCYDAVNYISGEIKGVKIGMVGYTYPMNKAKMKKYKKQLQELRDAGCTFCIASGHWGRETYYALDSNQTFAKQLIDMGYDMVYGTGSHTCQMIRWYHGKVIFYGLSNFTFGGNRTPADDDTLVAQIRFDVQEDGTLSYRDLICIPFKMHADGNYQPYEIQDQENRELVWEKLYYNRANNTKTITPKTRKSTPASHLPETFLTTGYVDFRGMDPTLE